MNEKLTEEQKAAIGARGKVIVSASAGSGKTFVMIQKLANYVENGGDLDEVLAVTFTKKAAAQMKEKLRSALIARLAACDDSKKVNLKAQLNKIPSADISTIHSFCSHLLRTYFYALDIDSSFEIIADDDAQAMTLKNRALDNLFDRLYEQEDKNFLLVLSSLRRKRSDDNVKFLLLEAHKSVRMIADYEGKLRGISALYTEEGFAKVCAECKKFAADKCAMLLHSLDEFEASFTISAGGEKYKKIFAEMRESLNYVMQNEDIFAPLHKLYTTAKPKVIDGCEEESNAFSDFRDNLKDAYDKLYGDLEDRQTELEYFLKSGELAVAFSDILLQFDAEYTLVKRDEGKLDYNDLEHLTLKLLSIEEIKNQINSKYKYVFVDEYQDVNPVQESILNAAGAFDSFTVGDVKQAIYGFRGSKSVFFSSKYADMSKVEGQALKLSNNFRSADGVIDFVNSLFSKSMIKSVCGFNYKNNSEMLRGGGYPSGYGKAEVHVFGKDDSAKEEASGIYSVAERAAQSVAPSREGLAVLEIVKRELSSQRYDLKEGKMVDVQTGDICILTRKRTGDSVTGIVRALTDAGYAVAGAKEANICDRAEVKQMLDILSYIDNCQQDIPLASALLSPLGGLTEEELAKIRIAQTQLKLERPLFRECAISYATTLSDELAHKLARFFRQIMVYRRLSDVLGAAKLIDKIMMDSGLTAKYSAGGGEKLASIRRLAEEAYSPAGELSLNAFLNKIKAGGYRINAPVSNSSDSIKVMTMHASKGLEFPVVIIADAAASFKGRDASEMPFDDEYCFAPKYYDRENKLQHKTLLSTLCKTRLAREDIKNELNLFYVACTRAMCSLHIMVEELEPFSAADMLSAKSYTELFDFSPYTPEYMQVTAENEQTLASQILISEPSEEVYNKLADAFMPEYPRAESVNLPVKSSASLLLKLGEEDNYYAENNLYPEDDEQSYNADGEQGVGETEAELFVGGAESEGQGSANDFGETSAERGTAYHRYLQLCDFSVKDRAGVQKQIESFVQSGLMTGEQAELLDCGHLEEILSMPVFDGLERARLLREQEFLCRLPACDFLPTSADDGVLIQGAIDLLSIGEGGVSIIDYKYSKKSDNALKEKYAAQLSLYKKAVSKILKVEEKTISATIVNIYLKRQIPLNI
jgi:ATP-dependent helicase/nuclease subunit A